MRSLKREWHIIIITAYCNFYFGTICITIVIASTFIGDQNEVSKCLEFLILKILPNFGQSCLIKVVKYFL